METSITSIKIGLSGETNERLQNSSRSTAKRSGEEGRSASEEVIQTPVGASQVEASASREMNMAILQHVETHAADNTLLRFRDWLVVNFHDDASTYLHEAVHVVYHRRLFDNPAVYGPHWMDFRGERRWALGSVEGLPASIRMAADPVLVGKTFLGPAVIEECLWPEWKQEICKEAEGDVENYDNWFAKRYRENAEVKRKLSDKVRSAVHRDLLQPLFRNEIFATAVEYEARVFGESNQ